MLLPKLPAAHSIILMSDKVSDKVFGGRYAIKKLIAHGNFGDIYRGEDTKTKRTVAMKIEKLRTEFPQLSAESTVYSHLAGCVNVPKVYYFGTEIKTCALVMEYLGKSLDDLLQVCGGKFTLKTVLMLADQMLSSIEFIHRMNYIHGDVKPGNFLMGTGNRKNQVYVIDFGMSRFYRDPHQHTHIRFTETRLFSGTARFSSACALMGREQSRRDDMEALAYVWAFMLNGDLPWMSIKAESLEQQYAKTSTMKADIAPDALFRDHPKQFADYLKKVRQYRFDQEPEYAMFRKMFRDLFIEQGFTLDYNYDWSEKVADEPVTTGSPVPKASLLAPVPRITAKVPARRRMSMNVKTTGASLASPPHSARRMSRGFK